MTSAYDVPQQELVEKAAQELKSVSQIKPPVWSAFAKTGMHKERPPMQADWWYYRAASVLKYVYKLGPVGVAKLRIKYGGRKNRGHAPEHTFKGSGNIVRKILQQLDAAGLTKQTSKGTHKGRIVTPKGKSLVDKAASQIRQSKPREMPKMEAKHADKLAELKAAAPAPTEGKQKQKKKDAKEAVPETQAAE